MQKEPQSPRARERIQPLPVGHHNHTSNGGDKNGEVSNACEGKGLILSRPPLERFQVIWATLKAGYCVNASEFAEQLEVSTKSIHRDLEFMRDRMGFGILYDAGRFGYIHTSGGSCPFCTPTDILKRYSFRKLQDPIEMIENMPPEQREGEINRLREWLFKREETSAAATKRPTTPSRPRKLQRAATSQ